MQFNIPRCSLFRVILIHSLSWCFCCRSHGRRWSALLIFCIAAITDWFDGFLARRGTRVRVSALSRPRRRQVLVAIAMVLVTEHYHSWWVTLPAATMIAAKIIISALREWMAEHRQKLLQ